MPTGPKGIEKRLTKIIKAWEELCPAKSFAGLTLDQFKAKVKPSFDARERVREVRLDMTNALNARNDADKVSRKVALKVVQSVVGDVEEGDDSSLYETMGFVRKSERRTGLHRKLKPKTLPAQ